MNRTIKSIALRFGLPLLAFVLILLLGEAIKRAFAFDLNFTLLIIALLIATAWFFGRAPGIFIALIFEAVLIYYSPPQPASKAVFATLNRLALFLALVVFASARRRAEQNLREQRELLQVTLTSIGDAVIATDADGRISFINPTAETLTGWTAEEAAGRSIDEIFRVVNEDTRAALESPFTKVIRQGGTVGLANHTLLVKKDGSEIPIDDSGAPIRDAKGNTVGVIIVFHDVSHRHEAEREREELLKSEKAARLEAEIAGRLKDEFLATVSHELRTPLSAILGWTVMLKNKQLKTEDAARALEVIERNARLQGEIINDLLDVSQMTTGKLSIERQLTALPPIIETVVDALRAQAAAKSVALECELDKSAEFVIGDPVRLRQIIWNLVSNAIKFTPENGTVEVNCARDGETVLITVRDSGVGIAKEFLPFVFDKFRQSDASPTRTFGGLGLGLSIVRHLVKLHGGKISAESEGIGHGAVFTVRLPLAARESHADSAVN